MWYREELTDSIRPIRTGETHLWLKMSNSIVTCQTDIYLCAAYIPPSDSPYYKEDTFHDLQTEICHFQAQGSVLLCGDFNARTGTLSDFMNSQGNSHIFGQSHLYHTHMTTNRNSHDSVVNKNGRQLLNLCQGLGLYIMNGRIRGDSLGRFTYSSALGNSVVDYAITDLDPSFINAFTVRPQTPLSDHSQITVFIKRTEQINNTQTQPCKLYNLNHSYRWAPNSTKIYKEAIGTNEIETLIHTFQNTQYQHTKTGVTLAVKDLNNIFRKAAEKSKLKIVNRKNNQKNKFKEKWFDEECKTRREKLRQLSNQKHKDPDSPDLQIL